MVQVAAVDENEMAEDVDHLDAPPRITLGRSSHPVRIDFTWEARQLKAFWKRIRENDTPAYREHCIDDFLASIYGKCGPLSFSILKEIVENEDDWVFFQLGKLKSNNHQELYFTLSIHLDGLEIECHTSDPELLRLRDLTPGRNS